MTVSIAMGVKVEFWDGMGGLAIMFGLGIL